MKKRILQRYYICLGYFAKKYVKKHKPLIIGINGSVGKTSCRTIIYQTLRKFIPEKKIYTSSKNFNGELGLSLSIFCKESRTPNVGEFIQTFFSVAYTSFFGKKKYDIIILEYGIDRPGEMDFLLNIAKPDIGVFTALDAVHSEQFGDPNAIAQEEVKMPLNTKELIFLNNDEPYTRQIINDIKIDKLTYQTLQTNKDADISFDNMTIEINDKQIKNTFEAHIKSEKYSISTNLIGKINYGYITVALAIAQTVAHKYGKELPICSGQTLNLEYELLPGRMTLFAGVEDSILIDSTYNASPLSMRRLIDTTYQIQQNFSRQKQKKQVWLALGDMRELGDFTEQEHRLLAGYCMGIADKIYIIGDAMKKYFLDEIEKIGYNIKDIQYFDNATQLGKEIKKDLKLLAQKDKKAMLLFKGSQNTIFLEEAVKEVLKDKKDEEKLVRQSKNWIQRKQKDIHFL